jgi:prolyl oligopeptidase
MKLNMRKAVLLLTLLIGMSYLPIVAQKTDPIKYPFSKKTDAFDSLFSLRIEDPYRWLENDTAAEVAQWVEAQNKVSFGYLDKIPFRNSLKKRLQELNNYEKISAPFREGRFIYYYKNSGLQNQSVLYRKDSAGGKEEVYIDPNLLSKDGTTKLAGLHFSKDGSRVAIQLSIGGADWNDLVVMDAETRQLLEDTIRNLKFSNVAWRGNEGYYYSKYTMPGGSRMSALTNDHRLYYHQLGRPVSEDQLIFGDEKQPRRYVRGSLTEDERYLIVSAANTTTGNEIYIRDLTNDKSGFITIVNHLRNENRIIDSKGDTLYMQTNQDAPNNKLIAFRLSAPESASWSTIIPESKQVFDVAAAGGYLFADYMQDVKTAVRQFDYSGQLVREIKLPGIGTAGGFSGKLEDKELYYSFTSFTTPTGIYKLNISNGISQVYYKAKLPFEPSEYVTRQVFYKSKDGSSIPMYIVHKKGIKQDGSNPLWLYSYGGFGINLTASFNASRIAWLEKGGIYAQPNIRGGAEYGEEWHLAGTKMKKQNVFDDFIAAAEYLIEKKYTSPKYLAIAGASNGGLLVGACMIQRPDLFKVAFPAVGVMDMMRYHKFTAGAGWAYDYGTAEDSREMCQYLLGYSPLHALKKGIQYPATMVTTADHDDRVVPAHSFKFAARLQECQAGKNPTLIRIDVRSGHGASNLSKAMDLVADQYAFAWYNMGIWPKLLGNKN